MANTKIKFKVFGKSNCPVCHKVQEKMEYFHNHWLPDSTIDYYDMATDDGLAEGAFNDVVDIPTVVLEKDSKELKRWIKTAPTFDELKIILSITNEKLKK